MTTNKDQELEEIRKVIRESPVTNAGAEIDIAQAILSAGYVRKDTDGKEVIGCWMPYRIAYKGFNGSITELYIDGEEWVRVKQEQKPRAKVPDELDRSFFCQSKDGYLLGVAIMTLTDTLNELIAWAKEVEEER